MTLTAQKNDKGLKRICGGCATRFYDFNKSPIACPKCGEEFTGATKIKSRRTRTKAADDEKVKPIDERAKAVDTDQSDDDDTISLEELEAKTAGNDDDEDEEDLAGDLDLDELANIDDNDDDDDDFEDGDDLDLTRVTSDS